MKAKLKATPTKANGLPPLSEHTPPTILPAMVSGTMSPYLRIDAKYNRLSDCACVIWAANETRTPIHLPKRCHCYNSVPESSWYRCEIGAFDIFLGIEHHRGEYNDGHG